MQSKISLKLSLLIISIVGIASSLAILFVALNSPGQRSMTKQLPISISESAKNLVAGTSVESVPSTALFRLLIPSISINAAVESVGLTIDGAMDVPSGPANVAWYNKGVRPGQIGSAVIDGHSGKWKNGEVGIFDNLYKLQKSDKIYVQDETGATTTFVVRELRTYDPKADTSSVFDSSDGKEHLNLITCEGVWNEEMKSYSSRLVVFTDKVNE